MFGRMQGGGWIHVSVRNLKSQKKIPTHSGTNLFMDYKNYDGFHKFDGFGGSAAQAVLLF